MFYHYNCYSIYQNQLIISFAKLHMSLYMGIESEEYIVGICLH